MNRLKAAIFLLLSLLLMAPATGLGVLMLRGDAVSMDSIFGLILVGMWLGGLFGVVWSGVALMRGR